jgi:hypothetical protein
MLKVIALESFLNQELSLFQQTSMSSKEVKASQVVTHSNMIVTFGVTDYLTQKLIRKILQQAKFHSQVIYYQQGQNHFYQLPKQFLQALMQT